MSEDTQEMRIDPARAATLASQLSAVQQRITALNVGHNVRLVAVSKLKPANDILALHQAPSWHLHFGENYAQELAQKAELLPRTVQWHFIGGLQSGHCKSLARIPNLFCVSSVDTAKKATLLSGAREALIRSSSDPAAATRNDDFVALKEQRDLVAEALGVEPASLELSMGMSEDFEGAIAEGSGEVRVGSTIFGQRPDRADAKIRV
ncbi:hypothetical protein LLEC1_03931 [Akanthomyces lecanii]|uniref:PLP homeostasis protein n=1 Tax=Cordyceps confragosa TaxID=2714763 RepID=A0A179IAX0_CORDF|nr:hypothetical protein LLEC1_03931 [Akanthomyces lecanii]